MRFSWQSTKPTPPGETPRIELEPYDDRSSDDGAREAARQIVAGDALVVVGPGTTASALAAAPLLAEARIPSLLPYAHEGGGASNPTAFRLVFSTTDIGEALANNLRHVLGAARAVVIFDDDGYGRPVAEGFRRAAGRLGIAATHHAYTTTAEAVEVARLAAAEPGTPRHRFRHPR